MWNMDNSMSYKDIKTMYMGMYSSRGNIGNNLSMSNMGKYMSNDGNLVMHSKYLFCFLQA
jgi:hypothetical protein